MTLRAIVLTGLLFCLGMGFMVHQRARAQQALTPGSTPAPAAAPAKPAAPDAAPDSAPRKVELAADAPTSWSDPRVIAELVKNCDFEASSDRLDWVGQLGSGSTNPLMCLSGRDQSCSPDPCFDDADDNGCRARCEKSCDGCTTTCANQCKSCKASCKDDACRLGCAKQCATCQQGCIRAVDRCSTGTCSAEYKACQVRFNEAWAKNGCDRVCNATKKACTKTCKKNKANDVDACVENCMDKERVKPAVRCDLLYCEH